MDNPSFSTDADYESAQQNQSSNTELRNQLRNDLKSPLEDILNIPERSGVPSYGPNETRRMMKNVVVASIGFLFLFTAYNGMSNVMSSLYPQDGLGTYTNATVYGFLIISSLFLPTILMRNFTVKWSLVVAMFGYTPYMAAQYYPRFYTMLPAAALVGISAAPLWASKSFYLTHLGNQYADLIGDKAEIVIIRFFGIFFMLFQSSQVWGNLISSTIFSSGEKTYPNETQLEKCGIKFCPGDLISDDDDDEISDDIRTKTYIYSGVCLAFAFAAIGLVALLLDPLTRYGEKERIKGLNEKTGKRLLLATVEQMRHPYQLLIIPLTIYSGLEQGFLSTDFTQSFITCAWGVHNVGYVLICYGVVDAVLSISFGPVVRKLGRAPVYTIGALINVAVIITMFYWKPDPDTPILFFIIAGCWGAADAVWQTQINSLYGVLFPSNEEAAFSNYRLWESLGFIIAYVNGGLLCVRAKILILGGVLLVGMAGFYVIEWKERKRKRKDTV